MIVEVYSVEGDGQMTATVHRAIYEIPDRAEGPPETVNLADLREIRVAAVYRIQTFREPYAKRDLHEERDRGIRV